MGVIIRFSGYRAAATDLHSIFFLGLESYPSSKHLDGTQNVPVKNLEATPVIENYRALCTSTLVREDFMSLFILIPLGVFDISRGQSSETHIIERWRDLLHSWQLTRDMRTRRDNVKNAWVNWFLEVSTYYVYQIMHVRACIYLKMTLNTIHKFRGIFIQVLERFVGDHGHHLQQSLPELIDIFVFGRF